MSLYINKDGVKKVNSIYANVRGETKKIIGVYGNRDGQVVKLFDGGGGSNVPSNSRFITAPYNSNTYVCSKNGENWSQKEGGVDSTASYNRICFGNGRFIASASGKATLYSVDGETWNIGGQTEYNGIQGICFALNKFWAVSVNKVYNSDDGITWTLASTIGTMNQGYNIKFIDDTFFVVGSMKYNSKTYPCFAHSTDGINWTRVWKNDSTLAGLYAFDVCYGNNIYVFGGRHKQFYWNKGDAGWKVATISPSDVKIYHILFDGTQFVGFSDNYALSYWTSANGTSWVKRAHNVASYVFKSAPILVDGKYYAAMSDGNVYMSTNLATWTKIVDSATYGAQGVIGYGQI